MNKDERIAEIEWKIRKREERIKRFKNSFIVKLITLMITSFIGISSSVLTTAGLSYGLYRLLSLLEVSEHYIEPIVVIFATILGLFLLGGSIILVIRKICQNIDEYFN